MWVEREQAQTRFNICKNCPLFEPIAARCKECGCFMKFKVKLANAECPEGKWS